MNTETSPITLLVPPVATTVATPQPIIPTSTPKTATNTDVATLLGEPASRVWYRRPMLWGSVLLVMVIGCVLWYWQQQKAAHAAPIYATQLVGRGDLILSVTANGTLQPTRSINIGSELSGTVLKVNVDVNDHIKKGQVMVILDPAKLRDQILRSDAAVVAANAKVAQTVATVHEAKAILGRFNEVAKLSGGKVPSKAELDSARASLERALADDTSARAGVANAKAALSTDQINLSKSSISAPDDGVVLTRNVDPGNAVAASLQAVTLFTVAEDLAKLRLWVYVDEADIGSVNIGQNATFTVSTYPTRHFPARITRVGFGSTITDNVVTYLTYLDVNNDDLSLRPGMTATATIVASQRHNVLVVPNAALRFTPTTPSAMAKKGIASGIAFGPPKTESHRKSAADTASTATARQVWVLPIADKNKSGIPVAVAVTPGISDGHMTEIIRGELKVGMQVITAQKTAVTQ